MTDIVERLRRDLASGLSASVGDTEEAADEIERLRATLDQTRRFALSGEMDTIVSDEIERLREALRMIADGDVPRQHVVRWRQDGQLSKHDKCPHDKWMYDDCDECVASFARAALGEKE